jgi:hypothetical protein
MKIPETAGIWDNDLLAKWQDAAYRIGMYTGIFVEAKYECNVTGSNMTRIFFEMCKQQFETLPELKRAIKIRSFL